MTTQLDATIRAVKLAKAEKHFEKNAQVYGSTESYLRSLDCNSKEEAIKMLAVVQNVRIYKLCGKIMID